MEINEHVIHRIFRVGLWLKAAHSVFEIVAGFALVVVSHDLIQQFAEAVTAAELIEDPQDMVAGMIRHSVQTFSATSQSFAAYYLLSHGVVKLLMVAGVLANRTWAYPGFIAVMVAFIAYQFYKLSHQTTFGLIMITVIDLVVLVLAWHEYRLVRKLARS